MPESATAAGLSREASSLGAESLYLNSVSRSSSERSGTESRDILMTSMGEPTEFLPIKIIAPEIIRDIQEELTPIFDNYHKEMVSWAMNLTPMGVLGVVAQNVPSSIHPDGSGFRHYIARITPHFLATTWCSRTKCPLLNPPELMPIFDNYHKEMVSGAFGPNR